MAMQRQTNPLDLWRSIVQAGGIQPYIDAQLSERGFLVARRETDGMSERELAEYKKSLKAEAAERRRLRREAWAAFRAEHIVHLGDGVYWSDEPGPDRWDLPNAEVRAAENELPPLDSPRQLAEALGLTIPQLRWLAFHRDAARRIHYRRFAIPKRDGSERAIWAPMPRLKRAQHWILRNIAEKLPVHGAAHGFLPGRSILSNATPHCDSKLVVRIDLKDFFPTVTLRRVKGLFRKAGYREHVATLLALICTESPREIVDQDGETYYVALGPRCLPQGAPTSPAITNALCLRLDQRLSGVARSQGWRYTRYADDLTFSRPADAKEAPGIGRLLGTVRRVVGDEGFTIHDKKTAVGHRGGRQRVTGLVVNGDRPPRASREFRRNLRAAIHNLITGKDSPAAEPPSVLAGRAAFVAMTDPSLGKAMLESLSQAVEHSPEG